MLQDANEDARCLSEAHPVAVETEAYWRNYGEQHGDLHATRPSPVRRLIVQASRIVESAAGRPPYSSRAGRVAGFNARATYE